MLSLGPPPCFHDIADKPIAEPMHGAQEHRCARGIVQGAANFRGQTRQTRVVHEGGGPELLAQLLL